MCILKIGHSLLVTYYNYRQFSSYHVVIAIRDIPLMVVPMRPDYDWMGGL